MCVCVVCVRVCVVRVGGGTGHLAAVDACQLPCPVVTRDVVEPVVGEAATVGCAAVAIDVVPVAVGDVGRTTRMD